MTSQFHAVYILKRIEGGPAGYPTLLIATTIGDNQINLSWTIGSINHDGHSIERSDDGIFFSEIDIVNGFTSTYSDVTVASGTTYYYRVRAFKGSHYSVYTNIAVATTTGLMASVTCDNTIITCDNILVTCDAA